MTRKVYTKEEWKSAVTRLAENRRVFAPAKEEKYTAFKPVNGRNNFDFDTLKTRMSPKQVVFPQSERMFEFSMNPKDENSGVLQESPKGHEAQVVFGLRPCDAMSFELVRPNFDNAEYRDPWWTDRYETTTFVGMGCNQPRQTCFCTSVGSGPFSEKGLDAIACDLGESILLKAVTEKGEELLKALEGGKDATDEDVKAAEHLAQAAEKGVSSAVETDGLKDVAEKALFEAEFWKDTFDGCINCGACTYACPTCWCFDIQDETYKDEGLRMRNWDSCMFPLFTKHGMGHNPRGEKYQRVRQRFMHKFKYYIEKYDGGPLCVGCGRCVDVCPANIDIREAVGLMNQFSKQGS